MQITCSPDAERVHVESVARARHGAALVRVVPVPRADRLLRPSEIQWALAGRGLVPVEAMPPRRWLARVAWLLECSPGQLEATGRLTTEDGAECSAAAPHLAAELIRSHGWRLPPPEPEPGPRQDQPPPSSATGFSVTWRAARDAYLGHLVRCPACIAHRLRNPIHCETGSALRCTYDGAS
ncbi:hypothetical protein IMW75_18450 [Pseudomonas gregormendelii]|uniref:Uncharacterized protein n=1 Tax=Pseudomonas gregormendelii TaxID=1628277 RepID=A0ABS3ALI7_9PSED|nr:hypothetical protein [Pseudomonas gregormendelii]MBN3967246.1 hypothetical protein [Pseudomonas gregormendelii]